MAVNTSWYLRHHRGTEETVSNSTNLKVRAYSSLVFFRGRRAINLARRRNCCFPRCSRLVTMSCAPRWRGGWAMRPRRPRPRNAPRSVASRAGATRASPAACRSPSGWPPSTSPAGYSSCGRCWPWSARHERYLERFQGLRGSVPASPVRHPHRGEQFDREGNDGGTRTLFGSGRAATMMAATTLALGPICAPAASAARDGGLPAARAACRRAGALRYPAATPDSRP